MRYWQNQEGSVITFYDNSNPGKDWVEVIVRPKPQPKTWTKKVALFLIGPNTFTVFDNKESHAIRHPEARMTDWVEVTFTEKES